MNQTDQRTGSDQVREFEYDGLGFLRSVSIPEKDAPVQYDAYDPLGNVGSKVDGTSQLTYTYDLAGRLIQVWDAAAAQELVGYEYYLENDPPHSWSNGKLKEVTRFNYAFPTGQPQTVTQEYRYYLGTGGQLTGWLTTIDLANGWGARSLHQSMAWNELGQIDYGTYPRQYYGEEQPDMHVSYEYTNGWLTSVRRNSTLLLDQISYHTNGMYASADHHNGVIDYQLLDYQGMPRPRGVHTVGAGGGGDWSLADIRYDGSGNIYRHTVNGQAIWRSSYDKVGRLVRSMPAGQSECGSGLGHVSYDSFGNAAAWNYETQDGQYPHDPNFEWTVDPTTNRLTNILPQYTFEYDASGNLLQTPEWEMDYDPLGRLTRIRASGAGDQFYLYGGDGERIVWLDDTLEHKASVRGYDGQILTDFEWDNINGEWIEKKDYWWAGSRLVATSAPGGAVQHIHTDHLGTPRLITDENGDRVAYHEYYPFGMECTVPFQDNERLKFTGHERAPLADPGTSFDVDYMHARYYTSWYFRFFSVDPVRGDPRRPQSWNGYSYVVNNPLGLVDPFGMQGDPPTSGCADGSPGDTACPDVLAGEMPVFTGEIEVTAEAPVLDGIELADGLLSGRILAAYAFIFTRLNDQIEAGLAPGYDPTGGALAGTPWVGPAAARKEILWFGPNAASKFRKHAQHIRETARVLGVTIGKGPGRVNVQMAIRGFMGRVVTEGMTRSGRYMSIPNARWSRLGDAIVVRKPNGEFVTFLDASKGGSAGAFPGGP